MRVLSTNIIHTDSQLLVESTDKSVDYLDVIDRFTSTGGVDDDASFSNRLAQGGDLEDTGKYVSSLFNTSDNSESASQVDPGADLESTVSFADDIAANLIGGVSGFLGLRSRDNIKVPSQLRSPVSIKIKDVIKKIGDDTLVHLLRIQPEGIGVSMCGGKFGKTYLHACATFLIFGASCGIKARSFKAQDIFIDVLHIQTPSKTTKAQKIVYVTPFLPIMNIDQEMIAPLFTIKRTVDIWSSLLPSLISLSSDECIELVKSID